MAARTMDVARMRRLLSSGGLLLLDLLGRAGGADGDAPGFHASGISRTSSMRKRPLSNAASLTWT